MFEFKKIKTAPKNGKDLYSYQKKAIDIIFNRFEDAPEDYHLLYQLPTGGGKTVIFSEIVKQYLRHHQKKVLVLTHRIELSKQTSAMLTEFGVKNKIIHSKAILEDQNNYSCFVAMVETLNNRLIDRKVDISDIGLVIIDEAHINSFTKIFKFFNKSFFLGVTATPLSSNINLPMTDNYEELIVGESIASLINNNFLAQAKTFSYNVGLTSLVVGANGDYTVKSSEDLYTTNEMSGKLVDAYESCSQRKKTLIFNNGINTSLNVYHIFKARGYPIAHLDNTTTKQERARILSWFKVTPDAILTSVSILTTGFDEPTVDTIILNRATKSLTLYYQMIGRGSRILKDKPSFNVIDLGNNFQRFGLWGTELEWDKIFRSPQYYLEKLLNDEDIERDFPYVMPDALREKFSNSVEIDFDIKKACTVALQNRLFSKAVLTQSIGQHALMCVENSDDVNRAVGLAILLTDSVDYRIKQYLQCICKSTDSFKTWLIADYKMKLRGYLHQNFERLHTQIHAELPKE